MRLLLRSVALAVLLAGHLTVSWPAAQWLGESDQWQHRARPKRQEADPVSPVEVQEAEDEVPPLESGSGSGSGSQEEEPAAEEDGSSEGSGVNLEGTDGSGSADGSLEGSAAPHESSSHDSEEIEESGDDFLEEKINAEVEGGAETFENGKLAEEGGDSKGNGDGSGDTSESSLEPKSIHDLEGSGDIETGQSGNSDEYTSISEDVPVEVEAVVDEVLVDAEAVHGEEGSGGAIAEAELVGQIDAGNHTDESQVLADALDEVEDVNNVEEVDSIEDVVVDEDVDVIEEVENAGSESTDTADQGNLEYEDGQESNREGGELETSLESPEETDSGTIFVVAFAI